MEEIFSATLYTCLSKVHWTGAGLQHFYMRKNI